MDEEIKEEAISPEEGTGDDNTPVESPNTEEITEEVPQPSEDIPQDGDTETEEAKGKGAAQRIKELNSKAKAAEDARLKEEARANSLEAKIAELQRQSSHEVQVPQYNPQQPIVEPGEEIDVAELNRRIAEREQRLLQAADARSELRAKQSEAISRHTTEIRDVVRAYPQLDPKSEAFNPKLSQAISKAVDSHIKASPYTASVKSFVEDLMQPFEGAVSQEVGKATENIAKQVSGAALRPTSVRKAEKTASEKSIAELEAELGIVQA